MAPVLREPFKSFESAILLFFYFPMETMVL